MSTSRIGVCSWSLGEPGPSLAARVAETSIHAVQLGLSPLTASPVADAHAVVRSLNGIGASVISGMMAFEGEDYTTLESIARTGGVRRDDAWPAHRAHAVAVARLARDLDIELVTFHAGHLPSDRRDPERAILIERLRTLADIFGGEGRSIALETGQETAATLIDVLADLDHERVGVNFDPANMILYDMGDPVAALRSLAPSVRQIHVKDAVPTNVPGTWGREVPAGSGAVDWPAFFAVATTIEPRLDFIIEREAGDDRVGDIITARNMVAPFLEELDR